MSKNEQEALRWFLQGRRDGKTARKNADNEDYEWACFLYQQAAEKLLKAFLFLEGERAVLTHSTSEIAKRCKTYEGKFADISEACEELDILF